MEWRLESDEHGRPFGVTLGSRSKVYLSFTHSGNHVAAAASVLGPIGIDIEQHRPGRDVCRLADMAFGLNEKTIVAAEGYSSFYRFWTLREAVSKAAGVGMPMVIDGVDRFSSEPDQGYWQSSDGHWLLAHFRLNDSVNISLALDADHVPKLDHWSSSSVAWLDSVVIRKQLGCSMTDRPIGQNRTSDA
ncbi:MAG: 4'-phosphopantetheinyl transferase superfamily protein [Pseudomonadota bacterium]